jgi:phosphatidylglycerophosphatase A
VTAARPSAQFLVSHPAHFVALGFGSGLAPFAPGTFGTLAAIALAALLRTYGGEGAFVTVTVALLVIGTWAADTTGRDLGAPDHGSIVVDEIAAFLVVLYFVGADPWGVAAAFLVFRVFDITKPPPIRQIDARWKNGAGAMADDLVAAGYTLVVLALARRTLGV